MADKSQTVSYHKGGRFSWILKKPVYKKRPLPPKRRKQIESALQAKEREKAEADLTAKQDAEWAELSVWEQA